MSGAKKSIEAYVFVDLPHKTDKTSLHTYDQIHCKLR